MPRSYNKYEFGTSPRKLEPEYTLSKKQVKSKKPIIKQTDKNQKTKINIAKIKKKKLKTITYVIISFIIVFGISFRNSLIDQNFEKVQELKQELFEIEKQNAQLKVTIENSSNLTNLEKEAKELLGMQKLTNKQTVYINLPKSDYIEAPTEEVIIADQTNTLEKIINGITNIFK